MPLLYNSTVDEVIEVPDDEGTLAVHAAMGWVPAPDVVQTPGVFMTPAERLVAVRAAVAEGAKRKQPAKAHKAAAVKTEEPTDN